jgi:hypothetical protein
MGAVGTHRTAWHFFFAILLRKRGPRWIEVRDEVPLSDEPPRLDYLILRRLPEIPTDDSGQTFRGLWHRLPRITIAELKTIGRPYRPRNLDRLLGYLHLYFSADDGGDAPVAGASGQPLDVGRAGRRPRAVPRPSDLAGLLIVPARTPTLEREIKERGLVWHDLGGGYGELAGGLFRLLVAEIDVVADAEDDDMVRLFGYARGHTLEARRFWAEQVGTKEAMMAVQDLEDYDEVVRRFLELLPPEKRMEGLAPEQRVAGLTPEQVVRAFAPEQVVRALAPEQVVRALAPEQVVRALAPDQLLRAMPDEMLRALSDDFIEKLPEPTRTAVRKRLGR